MSKTDLLKKNYGLYINGEWTKCSEGEPMTVTNPANGEDLSTIVNGTKEDVSQAVHAAEKAFKSWRNTTRNERTKLLHQIAVRKNSPLKQLCSLTSDLKGEFIL